MAVADSKQINRAIGRATKGFQHRDIWRDHWERIWKIFMPEREIQNRDVSETNFYDHIYDSTTVRIADSMANNLLSSIAPPWALWFTLVPGALVPQDQKNDLRRALEPINQQLFLEFNLSNFTQEMHPTFLDLIVGTGCITVEPKDDNKGIQFKNIPLDQLSFDADKEGKITRVYFESQMPGWLVVEKYGKDNVQRFKKVMEQVEQDDMQMIKLWTIVVPNETEKGKFWKITTPMDRDNGDEAITLENVSIDRMPFKVARWSLIPKDTYGRGPAMMSYHDGRTLQRFAEFALRGAALDTGGLWTATDDGIMNPQALVLEPNKVIQVGSNDLQNPSIRKLDTPTSMDTSLLFIQQLRQQLEDAFLQNQFGPPTGTPMTATEVIQRKSLIQQKIGAPYGRIQTELLIPVVADAIDILIDQGRLPDVARLRSETKGIINVTFLASLAQAQRVQDAQNMIEWASVASQLSQADPTAASVMNMPEIIRSVGDLMSVSPGVMRDKEEQEEFNQNIMAAAQQTAQEQQAAQEQGAAGAPIQ